MAVGGEPPPTTPVRCDLLRRASACHPDTPHGAMDTTTIPPSAAPRGAGTTAGGGPPRIAGRWGLIAALAALPGLLRHP